MQDTLGSKMSQTNQFMQNVRNNDALKGFSFDVDPTPLDYFDPDDSIEFHAGRIMLLLKYCAVDKMKEDRVGIKGRTKLAKLDFFLRYPSYLEKALELPNVNRAKLSAEIEVSEKNSIEAKMVRYRYGPWDSKYYDVFAYLLSKDLMDIVSIGGVDYFSLTNMGEHATEILAGNEAFRSLVTRCNIIRLTLGRRSGKSLKKIIYENFPEIVRKPIGSPITGIYDD